MTAGIPSHALTVNTTRNRYFATLFRGYCACGMWFCNAYSEDAATRRHQAHLAEVL